MKKLNTRILAAVACVSLCAPAQAQRIQQTLGRGVVAVQNGNTVNITWRKLAQEPEAAQYNVYQRTSGGGSYTKLNGAPLTKTNLTTTTAALPVNSEVAVALVLNGVEQPMSDPFKFQSHSIRSTFLDITYSTLLASNAYTTKFVWPADLTGDGEYDFVVDRLSLVDGVSDKIEGYTRFGEHLWTVDMGPNVNIDAGHNDMVVAYDINCDGKAEVIIKSSDGTRFWNKSAGTWGAYLKGAEDTDGDGITDYSKQSVKNPPQYITVLDGQTGAELSTVEMPFPSDGADTYSRTNKANYMDEEYSKLNGHMGIAYLDGIHPTVAMEYMVRDKGGTHHYYVSAWGYDFSGGTAGAWQEKFTWSRNDKTPWPAEFHHIRIADVNLDGHDEILDGGFAVNHTGTMLFSAGISHGDRFRVSDIDPSRPGLETFAIQQNAGDMLGQILYDAATGEPIKKWYLSAVGDVGRGECMDVDAAHKGYEMWSTMGNLYDCKGDVISTGSVPFPTEGVWWDGTLDREMLSAPDGNGFNAYVGKYNGTRLIEFAKLSGWAVSSSYGTRPAFFGDIIGDWRDEIILRRGNESGCTGIVGFSTDYATDVSLYCLQENPAYRMQCTTRGYYQSPFPDYYLGNDMSTPPLPPCMTADLVWAGTSSWNKSGADFSNFMRTNKSAYADGKSVLFDVSGNDNAPILINETLSPSIVYVMSPKGKNFTWAGSGSLAGSMDLWKSQSGQLTVNVPLSHTGITHISEGTLELNAPMAATLDLRAKGTLAGNATLNGNVIFEDALNYEGARLKPGTEDEPFGIITFNKDLDINRNIYLEMDVKTDGTPQTDLVQVNGNVAFSSPFNLHIIPAESKPAAGEYTLMQWTGELTGDASSINVTGITGLSYSLEIKDKSLVLVINGQRSPANNVAWTGAENGTWDYQAMNFKLDGDETEFVAEDKVLFGDEAAQTTVNLDELFPTTGVTFANSVNYTLNGAGGLSGTGGLTKSGTGKLTLNCTKSDYTGATIINGGTVEVKELADGGTESSFGAASAATGNWQMGAATLIINNANTSTNRNLTLTDTTTVRIASGVASLKGIVSGTGALIKEGAGQLNLTYGGANTYSGGTILKAGTLAMGAWNSTFGQTGKTLRAEGGTIQIFNNNSTSAVPVFNYALDVPSGKTVNLAAGQRCRIAGSMKGEGTIKLNFPYVRGDFQSTMSAFAGTLDVSGSQFRLNQATDMSQTKLLLESGLYMAHFAAGSGSEKSYTTKIGSLASTATDCTVASGTYNVGYNGASTTYAGNFATSANVHKYGDGTWTLTNTLPIGIQTHAGTVKLASGASFGGSSTVYNGGRLMGAGTTANVSVQEGGRLAAGANALLCGTLAVNGTLNVANGGIVEIKKRGTAYDAFNVSGNITLVSPTIEFTVLKDDFVEGDECKPFAGTGTLNVSGTPTILPAEPAAGLMWDTSDFATQGIIRVVADPTGIAGIARQHAKVWPTVVDDVCHIDLTEAAAGTVGLTLQSANGSAVLHQTMDAAHVETLNLSALPAGMYVLNLRAGKHNMTVKIVKR